MVAPLSCPSSTPSMYLEVVCRHSEAFVSSPRTCVSRDSELEVSLLRFDIVLGDLHRCHVCSQTFEVALARCFAMPSLRHLTTLDGTFFSSLCSTAPSGPEAEVAFSRRRP